jgi:hypothetical protein
MGYFHIKLLKLRTKDERISQSRTKAWDDAIRRGINSGCTFDSTRRASAISKNLLANRHLSRRNFLRFKDMQSCLKEIKEREIF